MLAVGAPAQPADRAAPDPALPAASAAAAAVVPAPDAASSPQPRRAFSTRNAHFLPAGWSDLPGWRDDNLAEAWRAFLGSCAALARRPAWQGPCLRARRVDPLDTARQREFFEREFSVYEIRNADRSPEGMLTGYYEPLIEGSRTRQGAFVVPVYGLPGDLLTLDIRQWPRALRGRPLPARIEGQRVVPVPQGDAPYVVDAGTLAPDERDKKLRLRLDGQRIVPYFTRAEIEQGGLRQAPVLAWVDNPAALYSMQVQGSGRIRLPDGAVLRLAYAGQNGHPFRPPQLSRDDDMAAQAPLTRGGTGPRAAPRPPPGQDADVERLVQLLGGAPAPVPAGPPAPAPAARHERFPSQAQAQAQAQARAQAGAADVVRFPQPGARMLDALRSDPSYVFFREVPDGPGGPVGALGVSLTAGRSVAVDPRTTPLGFPVFLASPGDDGSDPELHRLVMAQDTGGAIRGAVRADYFWGFGAAAYARAMRMKQSARMWLLLPLEQLVGARDQPLTRGLGAAAADCVVEDEEDCVEDR